MINIKELIQNMDCILKTINNLNTEYESKKQDLLYNQAPNEIAATLELMIKLRHWEQSLITLQKEMLDSDISEIVKIDTPPTNTYPIIEIIETIETNQISIEENETPTLSQPQKQNLYLFNENYTLNSFSEIFILVAETLVSKNPYEIIQFPKEKKLNTNDKQNFSYNSNDIKNKPHRLTNGMYIEIENNNKSIAKLCNDMLLICGYNINNISIN